MPIRVRLLLSYIAMMVIPLTLTVIAAIVLLFVNIGSMQHAHALGPGFLKQLPELAMQISSDIDDATKDSPDKLKDQTYLDSLDAKLQLVNSGLVVRAKETGKVLYISDNIRKLDILDRLPAFREAGKMNYDGTDVQGVPYTIKQNDFAFSDGSHGTIYLLTDISFIGKFMDRYLSSLSTAIIIIVVLCNGLITYFMSRSIIRPLKILMAGTKQIKEGNLNFQVRPESTDELGELCNAFEEMRYQLKNSIDTQLQYEENRKELISSITHDLKTPITSIKGYVEGIMDGVADTPEKMDKYVKTIYSKAVDMDKLIDDLFLFSKLDLKKLPFNMERINIARFFDDCMEEMQLDFEGKGIRMSLASTDSDTLTATADREKLKRVVVNILENASKHMDKEQKRIDVFLNSDKDEIVVKIQDNGEGIALMELPYIFDRFYRADASRNSATGGSGLGLAIAKQIVEGMGGRIWAESTLGSGTAMYFSLKKTSMQGDGVNKA